MKSKLVFPLAALCLFSSLAGATLTLKGKPKEVQFAYQSEPGLLSLAKGRVEYKLDPQGHRMLVFVVNDRRVDAIDFDSALTMAPGEIESVELISYMDYEGRAGMRLNRLMFERQTPNEYFIKPLILVKEAHRIYIYKVGADGGLTYAFDLPTSQRAQTSTVTKDLKDREHILKSITEDLVVIQDGARTVYYSPALKGLVNADQFVPFMEYPRGPSLMGQAFSKIKSCAAALTGDWLKIDLSAEE